MRLQVRYHGLARAAAAVVAMLLALTVLPAARAAREREPNSIYAERRAQLAAQLERPIVLFGYMGRENASPSYVFSQEQNFYYLTGHNEAGAALLVMPPGVAGQGWQGPQEILFLPPRDSAQERWDGPRLSPTDPEIAEKTGFASVAPFGELTQELEEAAELYSEAFTLVPQANEAGYPHAKEWTAWLSSATPGLTPRDATPAIGAMRQVKSPGEIALLTKAIELSVDAHLEAMRVVQPGLYEYQVAAKMKEVHAWGGCEGEAYAPIVGTGIHSTILHYNLNDARIEDGDVVLLDVGAQCSGYAADVTRTLPATGRFTPRQREVYEIVLGAQNAVLDALRPGMTLGRGPNSLFQIAYDYIDSHGTDSEGRSLGRYFIHGLGHHIGLDVHDAGDANRPLVPGMVVTIEPGVYIPQENLGVRIEDDVLITENGYQLLSSRLPRTVAEIEAIMAEARAARGE